MKFLLVNAYLNTKKNYLSFLNFEKAILQVNFNSNKIIIKDYLRKTRSF